MQHGVSESGRGALQRGSRSPQAAPLSTASPVNTPPCQHLPALPPASPAAPHPRGAKESACGCAGLFSAPVALALYAHAFEKAGALQHFEAFASFNGPDFYGLPRNTGEPRAGLVGCA